LEEYYGDDGDGEEAKPKPLALAFRGPGLNPRLWEKEARERG